MRVRVKICGVTSEAAVSAAAEHHADAIGFVFAESPRNISVESATQLRTQIPPFLSSVAVFRHPSANHVNDIIDRMRPDLIQAEPNDDVVKVVKRTGVGFLPVLHDDGTLETQLNYLVESGVRYAGILLEAAGRGGRGVSPDLDRAADLAKRFKLVLAGGLTPLNVAEAISRVRPFAVDVSSGVESSPGVKDPRLIRRFLQVVHRIPDHITSSIEVTP